MLAHLPRFSFTLWLHTMKTHNNNTAAVFQTRRKDLILSIKRNIPTLAVGMFLMFLAGDPDKFLLFNSWIMGLSGFCMFSLGIILITRKIIKVYRCPQCNAVPMGSSGFLGTGGFGIKNRVILNPAICPSCGAQLK